METWSELEKGVLPSSRKGALTPGAGSASGDGLDQVPFAPSQPGALCRHHRTAMWEPQPQNSGRPADPRADISFSVRARLLARSWTPFKHAQQGLSLKKVFFTLV